jgi:Tfp pilus assembly PilM family ATPase
MSRLVALEWDAKEARVVVARERGAGVAVERAFTVALPQREEGQTGEPDIGAALAKALTEQGVGRGEALVAVGRSSIELKFLSTPPVPEEELPEIVRFQAMRQFTTLGDDWPLDFVPLAPNADGGMNVLAAAIAPDLVGQIQKACSAAQISVSRLVLRPFAAAALLKDQLGDGKCRMIVDLLKDDADLTVLIGSQVIFPRTVRLPAVSEAEILARSLLAEGRRTMVAAQNQLGGRKVEEIVIFGDGEHHTALKQLLENELQLEVRLIDPLDRVEWGDARAARPEFPGTFAPLLGMLLDEATKTSPLIDFLHPRKKPVPPDQKRKYMLIGAAAAAVVLLAFGIMQWRLWSLDAELDQLRTDRFKQEKAAKEGDKPLKQAEVLDAFAAGNIPWLDEISHLSAKFPPPEAARLEELTATLVPKVGGQMKLTGHVDRSERVAQVVDALRDKQHGVNGRGLDKDPDREELPWSFEEFIAVAPPQEKPPPKPPAAAKTKAPAKIDEPAKGVPANKIAPKTTFLPPASSKFVRLFQNLRGTAILAVTPRAGSPCHSQGGGQ